MIICMVCRGNLHRSPVAAAALGRQLTDPTVGVVSAGLQVVAGRPSPPELVAAAAEDGLDLTAHRARPVTDVPDADVYLTMTRQQARQLLVDHPWSAGRVAPYGELATILQRELRNGALVDVLARRSPQHLLGKGPRDIADPPHDSLKIHRQLVQQVVAVSRQISACWPGVR